MRPFAWYPLFLISIIFLAGCKPSSIKTQPIRETPIQSITISTLTTLTIPTLTLTPTIIVVVPEPTVTANLPTATPTPLNTLEPAKAMETIQPLLKEPLNCAVPCFWGIIPGKTRLDEARDLFSPLALRHREGIDPNSSKYFYAVGYESDSGDGFSVTLYILNNLVENIVITPIIGGQKEGSPREWIGYSPETLIKKYGKPSDVRFALGQGPINYLITMIMYFDDDDLIALYSGYNLDSGNPHSPLLCPFTVPFDSVRLWMGPNPPDPPLTGAIDPLEISIPLEKATSISIDQFTQLMLGDPQQACFIINGDVFP